MKKRILGLTALLCVACVAFSSCSFVPGTRGLFDYLEQEISSFLNDPGWDSSSGFSSSEPIPDDTIGQARTVEELERKYGFSVNDPDRLLSDKDGAKRCAVLDEALEIYSKPVIRGFLKRLRERECGFSMTFRDKNSNSLGETSYSEGEIKITIFAPRSTSDEFYTNGITVETIAHELGHAIHDVLEFDYGAGEFEELWEALNVDYDYGDDWDLKSGEVFAYEYGMTDYYEDVATVFEELAARPGEMGARLSRTDSIPLYLKTKLLYTHMSRAFDLSESALFKGYLKAKRSREDNQTFERSYDVFMESLYGANAA